MITGEEAALALLAAACHPDAEIKEEIAGIVDGWVAELDPSYTLDELRQRLDVEKGTALEPFALSELGRELAARFSQVAFSAGAGRKRFRIVSEETLGVRGGCLLTSRLNSHYVERFGKTRRSRSQTWFVAPAGVIQPNGTLHNRLRSRDSKTDFVAEWVSFPIENSPQFPRNLDAEITQWLGGYGYP